MSINDNINLLSEAVGEYIKSQDNVFPSRALAQAAELAEDVHTLQVLHSGNVLQYKRDVNGTALSTVGADWSPAGKVTPLHWGALNTGVEADAAVNTAAFHAMWDWCEEQAVLFATNSNSRNLFHRVQTTHIYLPTGHYHLSSGWHPNSNAGRAAVMYGDGAQQTVIQMPVDGSEDYLISFDDRTGTSSDYENAYYNVDLRGFKLVGGKGLYMNFEPDASFVQRGVTIQDVDVMGFTEVAVGSLWGDDPRWKFSNVFIETTAPNTKGLYLPAGVANPTFDNVSIIGCTYKVVLAPAHQSTGFISGITMFSLPNDGHVADVWMQPVDPEDMNDGRALVLRENRFSNENRGGTPIVLIADADGIGLPHTQAHSTAVVTGGRRFRDWHFVENVVSGQGTADDTTGITGPMIRSYTNNIGGSVIKDNVSNVAFSDVLEIMEPPTINKPDSLQIGPNSFVGGVAAEAPSFCNERVGKWISSAGYEVGGSHTTETSLGSVYNASVISLTSSGTRVSTGTATYAATAALAATDPFGMSDARSLVFSNAGGYMEIDCDPTELSALSLPSSGIYWVEFYNMFIGGSFGLEEVDVEVLVTAAGGTKTYKWSYAPSEAWSLNRFSFSSSETPTGVRLRIKPSSDDWSATKDRTLVARPIIYQSNRPVTTEPPVLPTFSKSALVGGVEGAMAYCDNAAGGKTPVFYDGTNWRVIHDRSILA